MKKLSELNRSRALSVLVLAAVFLLIFYCSHETNLVADDYRYCFSYADDSRIETVPQIIPSMAAHRHTMNGRVAAHFLVQLFLLMPKTVFDIVNALLFTALVWLICRLAIWDGKPNALLLLTVFGCLWILQPDFGQTFLWLTGSINYLWCGVFCLMWLLPWASHSLSGHSPAKAFLPVYVLYSLFVGAYSENSTVALVAMALFFLLLQGLETRRRPEAWELLSLAAVLLGFFFMMLAPAERVNKSAEFRLSVLLENFAQNARYYLRLWPLLVCFGLFYYLACKNAVSRKLRLLSLAYLLGSLAGHFVLTFAMYTAGRSTYIGLVLLIAANAVLFVPLYETENRHMLAGLCAVCLLFAACRVAVGVRDIRRTHALLQYNEEFIAACAAEGERVVEVPRPYAKTGYSALEGLSYLNEEDPGDWPNVYMAKYYGVDSIVGG
jgi:hypothetical protein